MSKAMIIDQVQQLSAASAYEALVSGREQGRVQYLIDVRTLAEWTFVGLADVPELKTLSWIYFPEQEVNKDFVSRVQGMGIGLDDDIYLLCRSGVRSQHAGVALAAAGFKNLTNVSDGFEGDPDQNGHRNQLNGWRFAGLPWRQQ